MTNAEEAGAPPQERVPETPQEGGSYLRQDDGSLKRAQGTEPAPDRAATEPQPPQDPQQAQPQPQEAAPAGAGLPPSEGG